MIFNAAHYAGGSYSMPDRENDRLPKDEKYHRQVAEYVYSQFCKGSTAVDYSWYNSVERNRSYARGQQDPSIYMDAFYGKESADGIVEAMNGDTQRLARKNAYANLNFAIQSTMPKIMDSIVGKLSEQVNRVSVDANDAYSGALRETMKWGSYVDGKYKNELNMLRALMALPQQDVGYTPKSVEELNLYEAEGGFKLAYEEKMETLLKTVFERSYWEEHTIDAVISDLVTNGFACVEDVYDKYTGQVLVEYRDAKYAGVQFTAEKGYHQPDYGFHVKMTKLSDLRIMGFPDSRLIGLASTFNGQFGNPNGDWNNVNKQVKWSAGLDEYLVPVFVVKWIDVDFKHEKKYKNRVGKVRTKLVDANYKGENEVIKTRIKTLRQVHWVIGSDIIYDWGKAEFQGRDGLSDPVLPIHMVKVPGRPIVPRLIPSLDQYMNAWMRLQQGISMAAMNGFAINMDAISNLSLGGNKMHQKEVLRFWRQTGTLFYKPTDIAGRPQPGMQFRPIEQLPGGAGAVIAESLQVMDAAMRLIEELTGINAISMGATPSPDLGKGVTEYAMMGTNDVLKNVLKQANIIKSNAARAAVLRLNHVISNDEMARQAYIDVIGETGLELIKTANGGDVKYGIRTHARPTQQDIAELKEMIALSLKNGRDGKVGITEADAVRFNAMINSGASLKRVALLLDFANKKAQDDRDEREIRKIQVNSQQQQQTAIINSQNASRETAEKTQAAIVQEMAKGSVSVIEKAVELNQLGWRQALSMLGMQMPQPQQQPQQQVVQQQEREPMPTQEAVV